MWLPSWIEMFIMSISYKIEGFNPTRKIIIYLYANWGTISKLTVQFVPLHLPYLAHAWSTYIVPPHRVPSTGSYLAVDSSLMNGASGIDNMMKHMMDNAHIEGKADVMVEIVMWIS